MGKAAAIEKMKTELIDLNSRIQRHNSFIAESTSYKKLDLTDKKLLTDQISAMKIYSDVLSVRIERAQSSI